MKKENVKHGILCSIGLIGLVLVAMFYAANRITGDTDILFPTQYIAEGNAIWYVMLFVLAAEAVALKLIFKEEYFKTVSMAMIMNFVSAGLGIVALYISGLVAELLFLPIDLFANLEIGTFHVSHWIVNFLLIILMNSAIEGLTLKLGFKYKFKKIYWRICLVNTISLAISFVFNLSWISEMFF